MFWSYPSQPRVTLHCLAASDPTCAFVFTLPMVWATSADPTTGKATKDGLWCKWGKSNGVVSLSWPASLTLLYNWKHQNGWICHTNKNWDVTKITDDDHWRPALANLLTAQLANKPQPSFGHAASLCEHLFYWLRFLSVLWSFQRCVAVVSNTESLYFILGWNNGRHRNV